MTANVKMKVTIMTILAVLSSAAIYVVWKPGSEKLPPRHLSSNLPVKYAQIADGKVVTYLIKNVSLIPMNRDTILYNRNVLIQDGRIKQITEGYDGAQQSVSPIIIDGGGQYLIPGLSDMHAHINDDNNLLLFLVNGITTVRVMAGFDFHLDLRKEIKNGQILGPTLYVASPILEGPKKVWESSIGLNTKAEASSYVKRFNDTGYDFIKVYHTLPKELYRQIMSTADSIGIPVVGHLPFEVELGEALKSNQYSIEHVEIRGVSPDIPIGTKADMLGESKKWICPTLIVLKNIQKSTNEVTTINRRQERYVDKDTRAFWRKSFNYGAGSDDYAQQKMVAQRIFHEGGRVLTGTDCLNRYVLAGFSLHEELQELVNAGLPEFDALKASTVNAAEFLRRSNESGTIELGKIADLVLLRGNPLADISNTKKINGVFVRGVWFSSAELDKMLDEIEQSY